MNRSETIGKIAEALCKAQKAFKNAVKDSENPYFNSKYADLTSVFDACREELEANGLSVSQPLSSTPEGKPVVNTLLLHTSGEWISSSLTLNPVKSDPQGMGSAITYGRRYSLESILGIAREEADDDGNAASVPPKSVAPPAPAPPPAAVPQAGGVSTPPPPTPVEEGEFDVDAHRVHLQSLINTLIDLGVTGGDGYILTELTKSEKFKGFKDLTRMSKDWQLKNAIKKAEDWINNLNTIEEQDVPL